MGALATALAGIRADGVKTRLPLPQIGASIVYLDWLYLPSCSSFNRFPRALTPLDEMWAHLKTSRINPQRARWFWPLERQSLIQ